MDGQTDSTDGKMKEGVTDIRMRRREEDGKYETKFVYWVEFMP